MRMLGSHVGLHFWPCDVNESKSVINIDFIIALKPDGLCVYETTKQDSI